MIQEPTKRIPRPSGETLRRLIQSRAPEGYVIEEWLMDLLVISYQSGRFDEACAETTAAMID